MPFLNLFFPSRTAQPDDMEALSDAVATQMRYGVNLADGTAAIVINNSEYPNLSRDALDVTSRVFCLVVIFLLVIIIVSLSACSW